MSPRACRIAPRNHEGARLQRSVARLRERRKMALGEVSLVAPIFLRRCAGLRRLTRADERWGVALATAQTLRKAARSRVSQPKVTRAALHKMNAAKSAFVLMIQTKIQFNLTNAKRYFREHLSAGDYYSEGQKVKGEWLGNGAEKLGLKGAVGEKDFLALCEGKNPETGLRLGQRMNTVRRAGDDLAANRRIFFDFTIAPPKSVSVVGLLQDDRILALHNRAVRQAMFELEKVGGARVRKSGQNGERVTSNIVAAAFRHDTSRELDPHLHTHCVVFNATFDPVEGRWKALEPAGMYRAQRFASNFYRHELCKGLRALGYDIQNHARGFEIKGVPQSVITLFSKRHQQIDEETLARMANGEKVRNVKDLRERVAHSNRRRKLKDSTADRLGPSWRKEMRSADLAALKALQSIKPPPAEKADVASIVAWADAHLFERRSVVSDHELMAAALERGRGQDFDLAALRRAIDQRGYVREEGTNKLTSREALGWELEVVVAAHDGRNQHPALNSAYRTAPALSAEQTVAVEKILGSRDFITLFRGGAGTGKSFALKEVERGLVAGNRPVVVLAPQRQQVQDLQADGLKAETVAALLQTKQLPRGAVVIVDEAGQVGGRDLAQLIRTVHANQGRLILSGDTRQHGPVAASDALRAIEKHAGLKPAEIQTIRRQDPERAASAQEREFIRGYREAVKAAADGRVMESFDRLDRMGCVRELGSDARREALAGEYMAAVGRNQRALVVAQTRDEVRGVNEAIRTHLRAAGKIGAGKTLTTCQPLDLSEAQKRDARFYEAGQFACFLRRYGRYAKGELCTIAGANERGVVIEKNGRRSTLSYRYTNRIIVGTASKMEVAPGDRLQLKFNGKSVEGARLNSGELVTVREVRKNGRLVVEGSHGTKKTLAPSQRVFLRGYAVTSYGSQGKTVDKVIFADAGNRPATSAEQWYVTISRGRKGVVVFTPDKAALRANIQTTAERELALDLKVAPTETILQHPAQLTRRDIAAADFFRRRQMVVQPAPTHRHHHRIAI